MARFISILFSGITDGSIAGLIALGVVLLFKTTGVVNFAQGDLLTLGAYFGIWLLVDIHLPTPVAYIGAILMSFVVGVVVERIGYAPLRKRPLLTIVISTFAFSLLIEAVIGLIFTNTPRPLPAPFGNGVWHVFGAAIPYQDVLVIIVTLVVFGLIQFMLQRTALGRQVRAVSSDREAALLQGIRASRLTMIMFGLSASVAAIGGLLIAPILSASPTLGFDLLLSSFAAIVLGGFDRVGGAMAAAILVGVIQQVLGGYVSPNWNEAYPYLILLVALMARPEGLVKATVGVRY
jgi:branched-chain amino acid transport system permease protein